MLYGGSIGAITLALALLATSAAAQAFDESRYPDLKGQWRRFEVGPVKFDPGKPRLAQGAPLTPEYRAIFEANLKDQDAGGQGIDPTYTCLAPGMPRQMNAYEPLEIVITPDTTYILVEHIHDNRRIFTDGRDWPADIEPSFAGYSIGKWVDGRGQGRPDTLLVETRALKGPRVFDSSGIPFHKDNQTVIKERIYREPADPDLLYDEMTVIDHALTRPWTVIKKYRRTQVDRPVWRETVCAEHNEHVEIAREGYMLSADGYLMPTRKDQPPPDLRYFKQTRK
ncbi:MAG TPA: hypothetical protein VG291_03200 [Xanthobacteraceae bacterium]|nr:hypothetical protein [Xanthobacteraceae bacterium]